MLSEYMFEVPLGDFLDRVGQEPTPGGGAVAALSIAMAAGLVEMASRGSPDWVDAPSTIEAAQQYRFAVTRLAPVNAGAYATARSARARTAETGPDDAAHADLIRAAEVPLGIAEAGASIAALAARVAEEGAPAVQPDAATAALLAAAAVRSAAGLVTVNLATGSGHPLAQRAEEVVAEAAASADRAVVARSAPLQL